MLSMTKLQISILGVNKLMGRLYMVLEYIEKGQVMVCNQTTMKFYSPITSITLVKESYIEKVLDEYTARHYMLDIISGLKYCKSTIFS